MTSETEERNYWRQMIRDVYGKRHAIKDMLLYGDLFEHETGMFSDMWGIVIKRIGYMESGAYSWDVVAEGEDLTHKERDMARTMGLHVLGNSLATVERVRDRFTHADDFLKSIEPTLQSLQRAYNLTREQLLSREFVIR
jgi:hypothetical protein